MTKQVAAVVAQAVGVVVIPVVLVHVMKTALIFVLMVAPELVKVIPEAGNSLI